MKNKYFVITSNKTKIMKKLKTLCLLFLYKVLYIFPKVKVESKKYNVSICAIFKNEAKYLKEWIEFHKIIGIDHFYLYNNNSEDDYESVLKSYIQKGEVTLIPWSYNQQQIQCYKKCIEDYSHESKWIGFIDIDEFIIPKEYDNIYEFLKKYDNKRGSVALYWKLFGSSGLIDRNVNRLVSEDFTVCWPKYCINTKCFYNTAFKFNPNSKKNGTLHHIFYSNWHGIDLPPVNCFNKITLNNRNKAKMEDFPIQINHYFTKSFNEYAEKRAKGDVFFKNNPHDIEYFYYHEMKCTDVDYSAYKYLIKLKIALGKNDK